MGSGTCSPELSSRDRSFWRIQVWREETVRALVKAGNCSQLEDDSEEGDAMDWFADDEMGSGEQGIRKDDVEK